MIGLSERLETYMNAYERDWPLSGTVLVAHRGEVLLKRAYGYANFEHHVPNTTETKFRIWSITKSFTAMAILILFEQRQLHLNDRLYRYFPEFSQVPDITITHLLTHTSGLINYSSLPEYNKYGNKRRMSKQEVLNLFVDQPLAFPPGSSFVYQNSGYFLLGMIIEKITGLSFENFLSKHLLAPLGMNDTGLDNNRKVIPQMSSAYDSSWNDLILCEYMDMSSSFSAGAMYSTVNDLYLWDQALYTEKLVSKETLDLAFEATGAGYGFGWFLDTYLGHRRVHHGGAYRGHRSELHRFPDDHATVIMLTNYDFVPVRKLVEALSTLLFGKDISVPRRPPEYPLEKRVYDTYMGEYEGFGCTASVEQVGEQWLLVWNEETVIPLYPRSEASFQHMWQDWSCTFSRDDQGEITLLGMKKVR